MAAKPRCTSTVWKQMCCLYFNTFCCAVCSLHNLGVIVTIAQAMWLSPGENKHGRQLRPRELVEGQWGCRPHKNMGWHFLRVSYMDSHNNSFRFYSQNAKNIRISWLGHLHSHTQPLRIISVQYLEFSACLRAAYVSPKNEIFFLTFTTANNGLKSSLLFFLRLLSRG